MFYKMQGTAKEVAGECKQKEQTPNKIQNFMGMNTTPLARRFAVGAS
jgi:hypothetical protein